MKYVKCIVLMSLSVLLTGCGFLSPAKVPLLHTYTLNSVTPTALALYHRSPKTLLVSLPIPNPGYASYAMIYEPLPFDLRSYANNQWAAPPAQMLMPVIAQAITNQGYFNSVVTTPFSGVTNYLLESRLVALQQNFLQPISREQLVLQETLVNNTTNKVIASRQFSSDIPAPRNDPYSGVVAANQAAQIVTQQIARWVIQRVN